MTFVVEDNRIIFTGTPSTGEHRKMLAEAGFVHVTGLRTYLPFGSADDSYIIGAKLTENEVGKWCSNNGMTVVITPGGEVWLKAGRIEQDSEIVKELCPNGYRAFVPLSNGEQVGQYDLLRRMHDPNYNIFVPAS